MHLAEGRIQQQNRGFSLVEILVALGAISIAMMALMTLIQSQNREMSALDEKMLLQGMQLRLASTLANPDACGCFLGSSTFNVPAATWNSVPSWVAATYDASCATVGLPLISVGTSFAPKLKPTGIEMKDVTETVVGSGRYSANLVVNFDQGLLTRSRKSISLPLFFKLDMVAGTPSARKPSYCSAAAFGGVSSSVAVYSSYTTTSTNAKCPVGMVLSSCLVETNSSDGQSQFVQHVQLSGPPNRLDTCASSMTDSNDTYRLVLICIN
jgi:prepilin-type N-terminal cleavage/methylation domain-containing protein